MERRPWNRNIHYHDVVLNAVPPNCRRALDIGCGDGRLAARLAERCGEVVAIDVHAPTLARARTTHASKNLTFVEADVMRHPFEDAGFDCITSIATLHHLPLVAALERISRLLRPGGVLALIGLYRLRTPADFVWAHAAMPVSWWFRVTKTFEEVAAPMREPDETLGEIRRTVAAVLPGAVVTRRLLFRYSVLWRRPS